MKRLAAAILSIFVLSQALGAQEAAFGVQDSTLTRLVDAGFMNVRVAETEDFKVYALENDYYKIPADGFARARQIIEGAGLPDGKPVKVVGTYFDVPEITMTYSPETGTWRTTKRLDESWDAVRKAEKHNSSFGKVSINVYPQVSLKNLIITQIYQSLWQLSPALEVSLWPGMKFTYQIQIPVYNDGYGRRESKVHPGFVTVSQRFRDPWNLNVLGKFTVGTFSGARYGAVLEMAYHFPNERFWMDTQLALVGPYYMDGFIWHYEMNYDFNWNLAANYYNPYLRTQFLLRVQKFLMGDRGVKYEMIRHFDHTSIGFYAVKDFLDGEMNIGFRFQIALPAYRMKRHGYWPKVNVSNQMGMSYNANNEQYFYREFRTEASDNIMSRNYFNPYYLDGVIGY